jgi:ABC-type antimicrobial peptide transport system permease subunit
MSLLTVNVRLALRSLNRNRMRTLLTMLGIIIGVAAVLTMVALGTGARASVEDEVGSAGTNLIFVSSGNYTRGGESVGISAGLGSAKTLTPGDVEAIAANVSGIRFMSPGLSTRMFLVSGVGSSGGGNAGNAGARREFARVQGISADFSQMYGWTIVAGRALTAEDIRDTTSSVVLGRGLADRLFGAGSNPTGKTLQLRDANFTVTGVITGDADDHRDVAFVPWTTLQRNLGVAHLQTITVAAAKAGEASRIGGDITTVLRKRHKVIGSAQQSGYLAAQGGAGGTPDDFTVKTQAAQALTKGLYTPAAAFALANLPQLDQVTLEEMSETLDRASDTMTALLASIAGVSLVVGGIGIMNIMLVSVTERTREIGLRMATGARTRAIALQFLTEAVTLSMIGGLAGLILGLISSRLVGWALGWPTRVSPAAVLLAVGIAATVGLVFGSYPARRAARLDPIEALRTE